MYAKVFKSNKRHVWTFVPTDCDIIRKASRRFPWFVIMNDNLSRRPLAADRQMELQNAIMPGN